MPRSHELPRFPPSSAASLHGPNSYAANLLGLVDCGPTWPEITVGPQQSHTKAGLLLHRSTDLVRSDICRIRGLRCTTATRTLIDLGTVVSGPVLESALELALHQRMTTVPRLQKRLEQVARPGRPGVSAMRRVLDLRTPRLAASESELELLIWQILRRHNVPLPQRPVERTVNEFVPAAKPPIRCGGAAQSAGFGVHSTRSAFESDRTRQNRLVVAGWLPLLFTWFQARQSEEEVADQVRAALVMRRSVS